VNAAAFEPERIKRTNERNFAIVKLELIFVGANNKIISKGPTNVGD